MPRLRPIFYCCAGLVAAYFLIAYPQPAQAQWAGQTFHLKFVFYANYQQVWGDNKPTPNYTVKVKLTDGQNHELSCNTTPYGRPQTGADGLRGEVPRDMLNQTRIGRELLKNPYPWGACIINWPRPDKIYPDYYSSWTIENRHGWYDFRTQSTPRSFIDFIPIQTLSYAGHTASNPQTNLLTKCSKLHLYMLVGYIGYTAPANCKIGSQKSLGSYYVGASETTGSGGGSTQTSWSEFSQTASTIYVHYFFNMNPTGADEKAYPGCISPRELKKRARQELEHQFITPNLSSVQKQSAQTQIAHVMTYLDSDISNYAIGGAKTYWEIVDPQNRAGYLEFRLSRITNLAMFKHLIGWEEKSLNIVCHSGKVYAEESSGWKKTNERFFEVNQNIADRIVYGTINFLTPDPTDSFFGASQTLPELGPLAYYSKKGATTVGVAVIRFAQKGPEAVRRLGSAISKFATNIVRRPPQPIVNLTNRVYDEAEYGFSTWTRVELSEPLKYFHNPMYSGPSNPLARLGVKRLTAAEEKIEIEHAAAIFRKVTNELKQSGKRYDVPNNQAFLKFKKQVRPVFVQVNQDILDDYRLLEELHKKTAAILGIDSKDLPRGQLVHIATALYPRSVAFTTFGVNPDENLYIINGYRTDWLANTRFYQTMRDWLKYKESTLAQSVPMRLPMYSPRLLKDSNFSNLYPQWLVELYANRWTQLKQGKMPYPRLDEKFLNKLGEIIFERVARRGQDPVKALYKIGNSEDEMGLTVLRNLFFDTWVKDPAGRYPLEDKIFLAVSKYRRVFNETIKYQQSSRVDREFYLQYYNEVKKLNEEAKKAAQEVFEIAQTL